MNMAENTLLVYQNNCDSINRNCVEVETSRIEITNSSQLDLDINKTQNDISQSSSYICTQEEAVDVFLAGEDKTDFDILSNIETDGDEGISFKSENDILECNNEFGSDDIHQNSRRIAKKKIYRRTNGNDYICKTLKKRSIKW
ncbi:hypothetical protein JTB14_038369 [Gonioctena quinquepunctata]|nr:hypothetical protein JTB14_038369 [Gonioctena quinquepunctata]